MKFSPLTRRLISCGVLTSLVAIFFFIVIWVNTGTPPVCPERPSLSLIKAANQGRLIFYVDPVHGNDKWKGNILRPDGARNGPFKTIIGAIRGVRSERKTIFKKATIYLLGGTHYVAKIIRMDKEDSELSIVGYPDDSRPIVTGAKKIPGKDFTWLEKNIWAAPLRGSCSKHIFIGDKRMVRARKPNIKNWSGKDFSGEGDYMTIKDVLASTPQCNRQGEGGFKQTDCPTENANGFVFNKSDINPDWIQKQNGNPAELIIFGAWTAERGIISKIAEDKVFFKDPLRFPIGLHPISSGWRYIAENIRTELDSVGEFFCDRTLNMLYIIPPDGALYYNDVYVSQTSTFFLIKGATGVSFTDVSFRHSHDSGFEGYNLKLPLLDFEQCTDIHVHRCQFHHIGHTALFLEDIVNATIVENNFEDIGYIGITALYNNGNPEYELSNRNILIEKNTLSMCGVTNMFQPSCMLIQGVANITIRENEISRSSYAGIRIGWQPTFNRTYLPKGKSVFLAERNHIHNYGSGILNDFAGIYLSSNTKCGMTETSLDECHLFATVRENAIYNSSAFLYGAMGIYGDTGVSSLTISNNWLYNLSATAINFHCGRNNKATNNMIYHENHDRIFGACKSIGPRSIPRQTFNLTRNVIYVADSKARMYGRSDAWTNDVPNVDNNVYFFNPFSEKHFKKFFPKDRTWETWRKETGNDKNSLIANPQFAGIANNDFRLMSSSPATQLGVESVDLRNVIVESGACPNHD